MSDAGKGIVVGLNNFKNNIHWCIGNGKQGKLGVDPRCLSSVLGKPKLRPQFGHLSHCSVSMLSRVDGSGWNTDIVNLI